MITRLILVSALAMASALPTRASILTYTDRTTMELAQPALTFSTITYEGFAGGYNSSVGLTIAAVNFVGVTATSAPPYDLAVAASIANWGNGAALENNNPSPSGRIIVSLPANVFAIGVNLFDASATTFLGPNGNGYQIGVNNGAMSSYTTSPATLLPGSVFFGATSDIAFQSVTFMVPAGTFNVELALDNFEIGTQVAETPEVSTLLAIGTGLIAMRWMRRRRSLKFA